MISSGSGSTQPHVFRLWMLKEYTKSFSHEKVIGQGGSATVYKATFTTGSRTNCFVVKRVHPRVPKSLFESELDTLTATRHQNLVSILGSCTEKGERILVLEYMPGGTLSSRLFGWEAETLQPLTWRQRLVIAWDVAKGLRYLHHEAPNRVVHRDLKPSNILLIQDDMGAKISNFGLVRVVPQGQSSIRTGTPQGTFEYLAPEQTGVVAPPDDVYNFGVILMELITGRKAVDDSQAEECCHIVAWFQRMRTDKDLLKSVIDYTIDATQEDTFTSINRVAEIACQCTARKPRSRPNMRRVVGDLDSLVEQPIPVDFNADEDNHFDGIQPGVSL